MIIINRRAVFLPSVLFFILTFSYLIYSPPPAAKLVKERVTEIAKKIPIPGFRDPNKALFKLQYEARDSHPISLLIAQADKQFLKAEDEISKTLQETAAKYRRRYGRHPPPGFAEWYKFAREKVIHNIDDFDQIMQDLRPFWSVPAAKLRSQAANLWKQGQQVNVLSIRGGGVVKTGMKDSQLEAYAEMIQSFVGKLPDMDIPINAMEAPRVVVPWGAIQSAHEDERASRQEHPMTVNNFTEGMNGFATWDLVENGDSPNVTDWIDSSGRPFLFSVKRSCPSISHANGGDAFENKWKDPESGIIKNFKTSTDLCTAGKEIQPIHGFMMASDSMTITHELIPIFGESKTSVNNDILIPAADYWRDDKYGANVAKHDIKWEEKTDKFYWRGLTSGGISTPDNWQSMQRSRLVQMLNSSAAEQSKVLGLQSSGETYSLQPFSHNTWLANYSDVAFVETAQCQPDDCEFYLKNFAMEPQAKPGEQFTSRYLLDVDGNGFSGQYRTLLQSRSLPLKATIFREWHDSRLVPWRHFVPLDNRFDDLISVLTYFIGTGEHQAVSIPEHPEVPAHEFEAKRIALQGRAWAGKVLRKDDIEIYMYRLLLEWGRLIDDNRENIGYSSRGIEVDKELGIH